MFLHRLCIIFLLVVLVAAARAEPAPQPLPDGFVYCEALIPDLSTELRYATTHNFVGERIDGYHNPRCIISRQAALALKAVQEELRPSGLGLKVYDAYRPQRAVDHFVRWAGNPDDTRMKAEFYPRVAKQELFKEDYIAARSGHSRGSTVDLTLVSLGGSLPSRSWTWGPASTSSARNHGPTPRP